MDDEPRTRRTVQSSNLGAAPWVPRRGCRAGTAARECRAVSAVGAAPWVPRRGCRAVGAGPRREDAAAAQRRQVAAASS